MSISRISRYLLSLDLGSSQRQSAAKVPPEPAQPERIKDTDAAKVAIRLRPLEPSSYVDTERLDRVEKIKAQVRTGNYSAPSNDALAKAIINELSY